MLVPDPLARHRHVGALGEPQQGRRLGIVQPTQRVHPRPTGVDHDQRPHRAGVAVQRVAHHGAPHPAVGLQEARHLGVGGDQGARAGGAAGRGEHQARVVGLRVVVEGRAPKPAILQGWLGTAHLCGA